MAAVACLSFGSWLGAAPLEDEVLWTRSLSAEEGLPQNFVTAMTADRDGFMWFGTIGGLGRWNGYEFESYRHLHEDPETLSASAILALHADRNGRLWVGTQEGIDRFDAARNGFVRYGAPAGKSAGRDAPRVEVITSDGAGRPWFAAFSGQQLYRLDPASGQTREYAVPGAGTLRFSTMFVDRADRLWVALHPAAGSALHRPRLVVFDRSSHIGGSLPEPRSPLAPDTLPARVLDMAEDPAGRLWIGTDGGGLLRYDPASGAIDRVSSRMADRTTLASGVVRSLGLAPSGELWVITLSGASEPGDEIDQIHRVDPSTLKVRRVRLRERAVRPAGSARLDRLMIDPTGVLWAASHAAGVQYADVSSASFAYHGQGTDGWPGLNSSFVRAIHSRGGPVWVGTPNGVNRIDRAGSGVRYSVPSWGSPSDPARRNIQALFEDRQGRVLVGTEAGLMVAEPFAAAGRWYRHDANDPGSLADDWVQVIYEDPERRIWLGMLNGEVSRFDASAGRFTNYSLNRGQPDGPPPRAVNAIYYDTRRTLWVGTNAGLAALQGGAQHFERVGSRSTLSDVAILSIGESASAPHALWLGTEGRGLWRFDVRDGSARVYTTRNSGLPDDTVYAILTDRAGRLWMSTNRGLVLFDLQSGAFSTYGPERGVQSSEFNARAAFQGSDGEMLFGGVSGLSAFFPDRIVEDPIPPRTTLTAVRTVDPAANDPQTFATPFYRAGMSREVVNVPYTQRDLVFEYVALHYSDPRGTRYFYKLDGYNTEWHGPISGRRVQYTNLRPGAYTFRVRAESSQGIPSESDATFSFVILPPFYLRPWFLALAGAAIVAALAGLYHLRVRSLRTRQEALERQVALRTEELREALHTLEQQARQLKELDSAKSRFFANISHEFRTPLTLTLGPLRDVQAGLHGPIPAEALAEIDLAIRSTNRQLALVDQLLTLARLDAGQLEFKQRPGRFDECVRMAVAPYESLARRQGTHLSLDLPADAIDAVFDEERLRQVFGNLLDNALKFTPSGGSVAVNVTAPSDGRVTVTVEDTGPGIPPADVPHVFERFYRGSQEAGQVPGTGIGLALARECVELHGGDIEAENRPEGGTRFTVRLPIAAVPSRPPAPAVPVIASASSEGGATTTASHVREDDTEPPRAKVLIVDDHPDMRTYLRKHLARDYEVIEASRADQALRQVAEEIPDVVICDVMMPGMDGYEFCRTLKADPETDFLPVILVTARGDAAGRITGLEGGADDYITKPFDPAEVLARIRNLLRSRERLKVRFAGLGLPAPAAPVSLEATALPVASVDVTFMAKLREVLHQQSQDESFDVEALAAGMGMSRAHLHRRIREMLDVSPSEAIIRFRLERAARMLEERAGNVGEVAYAVGFKNLSHFVKRFRNQYGETPAVYGATRQPSPEAPAQSLPIIS